MIKLYNYLLSVNCYKQRLLLSMLDVPHELVPVEFHPGREHESAEFKKINPLGHIPVIDDGHAGRAPRRTAPGLRRCGGQRISRPPSTTSADPVTKEDSSEARNTAAAATSSGWPTRPMGWAASQAARAASGSGCCPQ